jgi:hypothetical protein
VSLVFGEFCAVIDGPQTSPHVDGLKVISLATGTFVFPGKGPNIPFDQEFAVNYLSAVRGNNEELMNVILFDVRIDDQRPRFPIDELVARIICPAALTVIAQRNRSLRALLNFVSKCWVSDFQVPAYADILAMPDSAGCAKASDAAHSKMSTAKTLRVIVSVTSVEPNARGIAPEKVFFLVRFSHPSSSY